MSQSVGKWLIVPDFGDLSRPLRLPQYKQEADTRVTGMITSSELVLTWFNICFSWVTSHWELLKLWSSSWWKHICPKIWKVFLSILPSAQFRLLWSRLMRYLWSRWRYSSSTNLHTFQDTFKCVPNTSKVELYNVFVIPFVIVRRQKNISIQRSWLRGPDQINLWKL